MDAFGRIGTSFRLKRIGRKLRQIEASTLDDRAVHEELSEPFNDTYTLPENVRILEIPVEKGRLCVDYETRTVIESDSADYHLLFYRHDTPRGVEYFPYDPFKKEVVEEKETQPLHNLTVTRRIKGFMHSLQELWYRYR